MREIVIKDKRYIEDEAYPLYLVMKTIPEMDDAISITFIMSPSHKDALNKANEILPKGEVAYIASLWSLLERLEFMVSNDG